MVLIKQALPRFTSLHAGRPGLDAGQSSTHPPSSTEPHGETPAAQANAGAGASGPGAVPLTVATPRSRPQTCGTSLLSGAHNPTAVAALRCFNAIDELPWQTPACSEAVAVARRTLHCTDFVLHALERIKVEKCPEGRYPAQAFAPRVDATLHKIIGGLTALAAALQNDIDTLSRQARLPSGVGQASAELSHAAGRFVAVIEAMCARARALDPGFVLQPGDQLELDRLRLIEHRAIGFDCA